MGYDKDLNPLLKKCSNDELDTLVQYILKKGNLSEGLSTDEQYEKYYPNHTKYSDLIADEIRLFGGDTFANMFRGKDGPSYKEVACDVASKLDADCDDDMEIEEIEQKIILKFFEKSWEKMSDEDKRNFFKGIKDEVVLLDDVIKDDILSMIEMIDKKKLVIAFPLPLFQLLVAMSGFGFYKMSVIVANAVARAVLGSGLTLAGNATLTRLLGIFAGPIGWAISAVLMLPVISSPAFRVTIPCVLHIAMLRARYTNLG